VNNGGVSVPTRAGWSSVIFHSTTHDWYGRQHAYQAFARALAKRFRVLYVSAPVPWRAPGRGTPLSGGYLSQDGGLQVFAPSIPSGARFRQRVAWWRHLQDYIAAQAVRRVMREIGIVPEETLLLCMKPDALPLIRRERWASSAFWIADDWEIPDIHAMMLAVDVVLAASPPTMEFARAAPARCVAALGGGVDYKLFTDLGVVSELSHLRKPLLGYAGGLSARIDFPLLRRIAEKVDGTLVLVGPALDEHGRTELRRMKDLPNIVWLGHKEEREARRCLASFDVGLIPYVKVRHTLGCNPTKLYEYLAAGIRVVATDLPLLRYFADVISIATDEDSFIAAVEVAAGSRSTPEERDRRRAVATLHSYGTVVDVLIEQVSRVQSGLDPISPERAWRF